MPEQDKAGRKNWVPAIEVEHILNAANGDQVLKFALFCGFDAGLRRNEISEAKVYWFDLAIGDGLLHVTKHPGFEIKDEENRTIPLTRLVVAVNHPAFPHRSKV